MPILDNPDIGTIEESLLRDLTSNDSPWEVILFNDDVHTFEQVVAQLQKAIGCSWWAGLRLARKVHREGSACVYEGDLESCERVAAVLEAIELRVKLQRK